MAQVNNVRLRMGRVSTSTTLEFAEVNFSINFSDQEVRQNLAFGLHSFLYEKDDNLDIYHLEPNGMFNVGIRLHPDRDLDDKDDFVRQISREIIRPNGNSVVALTRRQEFDVGNQEDDNEEYMALVWVIPEIVEGKAWSNEVSINLG